MELATIVCKKEDKMFEEILDVLLDAFLDTLKVLAIVFVFNFILSFIEGKIAKNFTKRAKLSPLIGSIVGLVPECGFSVVAADMYKKQYTTIGTLIGVFIACSDEALPIMLSNIESLKMILPLLAIKLTVAIGVGYLVDFILRKRQIIKERHNHENESFIHTGCCHHDIEENTQEPFAKKHLLHPLLHSLKIAGYILAINILFGLLIYFVGENSIKAFLNQNVYITPILSSLVGLIPNCASSVIITQLYISSSLTFAATIAGLICNAGLGLVFILKDKSLIKKSLLIIAILLLTSLLVGYITLFIELSI